MNPLPIAAVLDDTTDLTIAVNLSAPAEVRPPTPSAPTVSGGANRQRIRAFIERVLPARTPSIRIRGPIDIAFDSMQMMQDTIARLTIAANMHDVMVEIPRDACRFHEFWRAKELIALGRERTARAFATHSRNWLARGLP